MNGAAAAAGPEGAREELGRRDCRRGEDWRLGVVGLPGRFEVRRRLFERARRGRRKWPLHLGRRCKNIRFGRIITRFENVR